MKRKPILKPKFQGCMNCSKVPETTLKPSDKIKKSSFMTLFINDKGISVEDITIEEFLKQTNIKKDDCVEITYISAFHDEKYELDTEDMMFKLVEQGKGYA